MVGGGPEAIEYDLDSNLRAQPSRPNIQSEANGRFKKALVAEGKPGKQFIKALEKSGRKIQFVQRQVGKLNLDTPINLTIPAHSDLRRLAVKLCASVADHFGNRDVALMKVSQSSDTSLRGASRVVPHATPISFRFLVVLRITCFQQPGSNGRLASGQRYSARFLHLCENSAAQGQVLFFQRDRYRTVLSRAKPEEDLSFTRTRCTQL